ncbi:RRP15-like protein [Artemia franciscana]|uniref:RRP15-like protein n=1 Tax=Artemia franciscana TaxID=6661 RepID=A0AA88LJZ5_ARTSF|nr:hypothetical protein QYM36_001245 [Artemia franciscana]
MSSESEEEFSSQSDEEILEEELHSTDEASDSDKEEGTDTFRDSGNEEGSDLEESSSEGISVDGELSENEDQENPINAGWADAISKVLASTKPKAKKTLILSRAKRDIDILRTRLEKEKDTNVGVIGEESTRTEKRKLEDEKKSVYSEPKRLRKEWDSIGRVKPEVLTNETEKQLARISTKGVVQLFNAVKIQQKAISAQLREAGSLETKRDKVMKSLDKNRFNDLLQKAGSKELASKKPKIEVKDEPVWGVLRDDFMEGGKRLKDWNKIESDED